MDRTQIIASLAILLFGAFVLGFLTHWIVTRLSRVSHRDLDELDTMAEALHEAELARDEANAERHRLEHEADRARAEAERLRSLIAEHGAGRI